MSAKVKETKHKTHKIIYVAAFQRSFVSTLLRLTATGLHQTWGGEGNIISEASWWNCGRAALALVCRQRKIFLCLTQLPLESCIKGCYISFVPGMNVAPKAQNRTEAPPPPPPTPQLCYNPDRENMTTTNWTGMFFTRVVSYVRRETDQLPLTCKKGDCTWWCYQNSHSQWWILCTLHSDLMSEPLGWNVPQAEHKGTWGLVRMQKIKTGSCFTDLVEEDH